MIPFDQPFRQCPYDFAGGADFFMPDRQPYSITVAVAPNRLKSASNVVDRWKRWLRVLRMEIADENPRTRFVDRNVTVVGAGRSFLQILKIGVTAILPLMDEDEFAHNMTGLLRVEKRG